jgi:hypothetical protein
MPKKKMDLEDRDAEEYLRKLLNESKPEFFITPPDKLIMQIGREQAIAEIEEFLKDMVVNSRHINLECAEVIMTAWQKKKEEMLK